MKRSSGGARRKIAVVGAGPGGLTAAMLLASRGFDVQVFEKAGQIGGRTGELRVGDYRFDIGPTFLMMKFLLDELFAETGRRLSEYLDCRPLDPLYRLIFAQKTMLGRSRPEEMRAEIERAFPGEGAGLDEFLGREEVRFRKLYPCLQRGYASPAALLQTTLLAAAPYVAPGRSLYDVLSRYFRSEELRLAFTFQSKYLGMSPWDCPGLFALIPYTEHAHGIYHVMGGLCRIPAALAQAAQEDGAQVHTSCGVRRVTIENGAARGVELEDGEHLEFDEVVVNADFGHAVTTLFAGQDMGRYSPQAMRRKKYSCSTFMLYLGLDRTYPEAEHHTIVFAENYRSSLDAITRTRQMPGDLSLYVRNSVTTDPGCAPAGHSALYVLAPVPNKLSGIDWEHEAPAFRERVLDVLESRTQFRDVRRHIRAESMLTPLDWERKMSVYLGATFNLSHSWDQMLWMRPHNKFELFDNVYLVGGGTHPGSGLPTIFESARISANMISAKYGVPFPAPRPFDETVEA